MDHDQVVRQKLTERYLLHELEEEARDEFEEHYFQCSECALDVRAASEFVETSKGILAQPAVDAAADGHNLRKPSKFVWWGWLQPQFAASAIALLIAVIGYQNIVSLPRMRSALRQPQALPWAAVAVGTWGASGPTITARQGEGFLLFVRTPPNGSFASYIADLYDPTGGLEYSLPIPAASIGDQWPVFIPGGGHEAGSYRIALRGVTASGDTKNLGSAPFTLQIAK